MRLSGLKIRVEIGDKIFDGLISGQMSVIIRPLYDPIQIDASNVKLVGVQNIPVIASAAEHKQENVDG